jgi:hypothetical protein
LGFSCGIVGLPNVGKSTLFNAITKSSVEAANYPFCTIEPNQGIVAVPDSRLAVLAKICESVKTIPTTVEFIDIAGLVKGASKGEGLGNKFLSHIRQVDAIVEVVRIFEDANITRDTPVDPLADLDIIHTELILADLDSAEKRLLTLEKALRSGDKDAKLKKEILDRVLAHLGSGKLLNQMQYTEAENVLVLRELHFLTIKPMLFVANVAESEVTSYESNPHWSKLKSFADSLGFSVIPLSAKLESEVSELAKSDEASAMEYLEAAGLKEPGLNRLIIEGYRILNLITYFTAGETETRAWTIQKNTLAPQAAGVIHSDFEKGFIKAEVASYADLSSLGSYAKCRENGKLRIEGKAYVVQDGDVCHFRFNN